MDSQDLPDLTTVAGRSVVGDMLMEAGWSLPGPLTDDPSEALGVLWHLCPSAMKRELAALYADRVLRLYEDFRMEADPRSPEDMGAPRRAVRAARQQHGEGADLAMEQDAAWAVSQKLRLLASETLDGNATCDDALPASWAACWAAAAAAAACQPIPGDAVERASGFAARAAWSQSEDNAYPSGSSESELEAQLRATVAYMLSAPRDGAAE